MAIIERGSLAGAESKFFSEGHHVGLADLFAALGPDDPNIRTSIVSFNIKGIDSQTVVDKLEKQNIILAVREIMDTKIVRASPHFFNSESQILKVIDAIKKL